MRFNTAHARRNRCVTAMKDTYSAARSFGLPHDRLLAEKMRVREIIKGCPGWVGSYVDGVCHMLDDNLYREHLVFGGFYKGTFYSVHSSRDDYYEKHGIAPSEYADNGNVTGRGHYWIPKRGEVPKPFFVTSSQTGNLSEAKVLGSQTETKET